MPLSEVITEKLTVYLNQFMIIGGMPAAVASWIRKKDIAKVNGILDGIINDYKDDFAKHAAEYVTKLTLIWNSIPMQLAKENKKFVFGHVKTGMRSKDLEDALEWLVNAGLIYKVKKIEEPRVPLAMYAENTNFKIYLSDIGILRRMVRMPSDFIFSENKEYADFRGAVTENFVLNEIVQHIDDLPYYWRSGATAEVDFIAQIFGVAIPIEAKAGSNKSKSFVEYISNYSPPVAVTTTPRRNMSSVVRHIPLYVLWKIADCVKQEKK
jgi:predicted AAA+ superfamily ATPase